jgi:site-specific recombinase XerD
MLFNAAVDDFLRFCAIERQLSEHTLQAYACDLKDFAKWLPPRTPLSAITTETLKSYLESMVSGRKLALATVRRRFACLRCFFRRLTELECAADPFAGWRLNFARRKNLPRALSRTEISLLLSAFATSLAGNQDTELQVAVRLMIATGVRVGELCKLLADDLSPDGGSIRIRGKGSRDRIVYIADTCFREELRQLVQDRRHAAGSGAPLFVNRRGCRLKPQSIRARLHKIAREGGLTRRITPHMLRHTAATLLIEKGADIRIVQRLLGHSSIATTEIYTHVSDEALRVTLERANVLGTLGTL